MDAIKARRPLDDDNPTGYLESDVDYVNNNLELCVSLLDQMQAHEAAEEKKPFFVQSKDNPNGGWICIWERDSENRRLVKPLEYVQYRNRRMRANR